MIRLQNSIFDLLQQKGSPNRAVSVSSDEEGSDSESPNQIREYQGSYPSPWPDQVRLAKDIVYNMYHYQGSIPCRAIFKMWFADQLPVRWENMLTSPTVSREKSRNARNQFSSFKTVVHVLLKHLPAYPTVEDDLDDLARTAMTNLMIDHGMDPLRDDEPNRSKIAGGSKKRVNGKSVAVESLFSSGNYQTRAFPDGTPDCIRSFFENRGNNPIAGKKRALGDIE